MESGEREPAPPASSAVGLDAPRPSVRESVRGVDVVASSRDPHRAIDLSIGGAPPPQPKTARRRPSRMLLVALAVTALVGVVAVGGAIAWARRAYVRGSVLRHVGDGCLAVSYVDFAAIERSSVVDTIGDARIRTLVDWAEDADADDGIRRSKDEDAKGRASALRALTRGGVRPFGDVRELAICAPSNAESGGSEEPVTVLGGAFDSDLLDTLAEAYRRRFRLRESEVELDVLGGHPALLLPGGRAMAMASRTIVVIGQRKAVRARLEETPPRLGVLDNIVLAHLHSKKTPDGTVDDTDERATMTGGSLRIVRTEPRKKRRRRAIAESLRAPNEELHKLDARFDLIVDAYAQAEVAMPDDAKQSDAPEDADDGPTDGAKVTTTVTIRFDDLARIDRALLDLDEKRARRAVVQLTRTPVGVASLSFVTPSIDLVGLQLMPWAPASTRAPRREEIQEHAHD